MDLPTYLQGDEQYDYDEQLNQTLRSNVGNNGFCVSQLTTDAITQITGKNYVPLMPAGTIFWNTTTQTMQLITVAAVPGVSDATVLTFTVS